MSPVYWTTATEVGEAANGFSLTNGIFRREVQAEFATGKFALEFIPAGSYNKAEIPTGLSSIILCYPCRKRDH